MSEAISRRDWLNEVMRRIEADFNRSADTHLIPIELPASLGAALYLKDESSHPTGSLKHRLARSLFLYALCNQWLGPDTTIIEASSGSTAVSEAYFARLIGLPFIAVVPRATAAAKIDAIRFQGGQIRYVERAQDAYAEAERLARETGGHYLDQFTYAERATDWRGNNNIAESIFAQMKQEIHGEPAWLVCGAGTGGTSATLGRYIRFKRLGTRLCLADPEGSVFHRHVADRAVQSFSDDCGSCIEGIGRARVEPSFMADLIDRTEIVTDGASIGAARALSAHLGRRVGGSTGTNMWACARIISDMAARGEKGSVVSILCDDGVRYGDTYFDDAWLEARQISWRAEEQRIASFLREGVVLA